MLLNVFWLSVALCSFNSVNAQTPDLALANKIIEKLDEGKESGQSFELILTIQPGADKAIQRFHLKDDGVSNTVLTFLDKQHQGQKFLSTADQIWFFSSRTRRAIKVPASQRLYGDASVGDISRLRYAQDYRPTRIEADGDHYLLELVSIQPAATYQKIVLWVDQKRWHPHRSNLFVASGKHMKTVEFNKVSEANGVIYVEQMRLYAPDQPTQVTVVESTDFKLVKTTPAEFTRSYLEMNRS
jgi:outer membrane lipoprotein-sorting protein